jgi:hypothetical protein
MRATGKPARAIAQPQCPIDCDWNCAGFTADRKRHTVRIDMGDHHASVAAQAARSCCRDDFAIGHHGKIRRSRRTV